MKARLSPFLVGACWRKMRSLDEIALVSSAVDVCAADRAQQIHQS